MKKIIFISLVFSVILSAQDKKLTLEESLQIGLGNSRQIKISESLLRSCNLLASFFIRKCGTGRRKLTKLRI